MSLAFSCRCAGRSTKRMCPKLRHILCAVVASGACECSTPSDATCWGSTPDPLEHDSHAAVRVCFANIAQNSRTLCVRSMGLGCCPTSEYVDSAIHMHCLPRPQQSKLSSVLCQIIACHRTLEYATLRVAICISLTVEAFVHSSRGNLSEVTIF